MSSFKYQNSQEDIESSVLVPEDIWNGGVSLSSNKPISKLPSGKFIPDITVFDLETTGLKKGADRTVSIAGFRFRDGKLIDTFRHLINPEIAIPESATAIHGITDAMVAGKPTAREILPKFLSFIEGSHALAGHNIAKFDIPFLSAEFQRLGIKANRPATVLDTLQMARDFYPQLERLSQSELNPEILKLRQEYEADFRDPATGKYITKETISRGGPKRRWSSWEDRLKDAGIGDQKGAFALENLKARGKLGKAVSHQAAGDVVTSSRLLSAMFGGDKDKLADYLRRRMSSAPDLIQETMSAAVPGGSRIFEGVEVEGSWRKTADIILDTSGNAIDGHLPENWWDMTSELWKDLRPSKDVGKIPTGISKSRGAFGKLPRWGKVLAGVATLGGAAWLANKLPAGDVDKSDEELGYVKEQREILGDYSRHTPPTTGRKLRVAASLAASGTLLYTGLTAKNISFPERAKQLFGKAAPVVTRLPMALWLGGSAVDLARDASPRNVAKFAGGWGAWEAGNWAGNKLISKLGIAHKGLPGVAGHILGGVSAALFSSIIPGRDDAYNTIEGLPHGGQAEKKRRELTDFGSGYQGLLIGTLMATDDVALYLARHGQLDELSRYIHEIRIPRENDGYQTIDGMHPGNRGMATGLIRRNTPFGSKIDRVKVFAEMAGMDTEKFLSSSIFQKALSESKVLGKIGEGGFGKIYLRETSWQGEAFKFVEKVPQKSGNAFDEQLYRTSIAEEARNLKLIGDTPSIPSLYNYDQKKSSIFMEYIPGQTLEKETDRMMKAGLSLPPPISEESWKDLEETTRIVSSKGIWNRDIRPKNMMYHPITKEAYWLDFGVTESVESSLEKKMAEASMSGEFESFFTNIPKMGEAINPISGGLHPGDKGVATEIIRKNTPFGSKIDRVKVFAEMAGMDTEKFLSSSIFKDAIANSTLIKQIGEGGMGRTLLKRTEIFGKPFKFIEKNPLEFIGEDAWKTSETRTALYREAENLKSLQGAPGSPTFYDYSPEEGRLLMEYVPGQTAKTAFKRKGPLSLSVEGKRLIQETSEVGASKGFIHGDIHGGNIIFHGKTKEAYLIDWGKTRLVNPSRATEESRAILKEVEGVQSFAPLTPIQQRLRPLRQSPPVEHISGLAPGGAAQSLARSVPALQSVQKELAVASMSGGKGHVHSTGKHVKHNNRFGGGL